MASRQTPHPGPTGAHKRRPYESPAKAGTRGGVSVGRTPSPCQPPRRGGFETRPRHSAVTALPAPHRGYRPRIGVRDDVIKSGKSKEGLFALTPASSVPNQKFDALRGPFASPSPQPFGRPQETPLHVVGIRPFVFRPNPRPTVGTGCPRYDDKAVDDWPSPQPSPRGRGSFAKVSQGKGRFAEVSFGYGPSTCRGDAYSVVAAASRASGCQ